MRNGCVNVKIFILNSINWRLDCIWYTILALYTVTVCKRIHKLISTLKDLIEEFNEHLGKEVVPTYWFYVYMLNLKPKVPWFTPGNYTALSWIWSVAHCCVVCGTVVFMFFQTTLSAQMGVNKWILTSTWSCHSPSVTTVTW